MKYLKKEDFFPILFFLGLTLILVFAVTHFTYVFGSTTDWGSQHYVIPDTLRTYFYETKDLFPEFLPSLGAGENIFYFSYHGLWNPIYFISYLFPFLKMVDFIQIVSILSAFLSVLLFYAYLKKHKYSTRICFFTSLLFLTSAPLLYHTHRHLMFVSYFPFLLYGFFAVDAFFEKGKKIPLLLTTFFLILMSFYYSIPSLVVLTLYGISIYLEKNTFSIRSFFHDGIRFFLTVVCGVLLSSFYVIPILFLILDGRGGGGSSVSFLSLDLGNILYNTYGLGITAISLLAFLSLFLEKKKTIAWPLLFLFCSPFLLYMLNGTLYVDAKVLIPFLPLVLSFTASFLKRVEEHQIDWKKLGFLIFLTALFGLTGKKIMVLPFLLDACACLFLLRYYQKGKKQILILYSIYVIIFLFVCNFSDRLVFKKDTNFDREEELLQEITMTDPSLFRVNNYVHPDQNYNQILNGNVYKTSIYTSLENQNYADFYFDIFGNPLAFRTNRSIAENTNLLFQILMGNKYFLTEEETMLGYTKIDEKEGVSLYQNNAVYPILYASNHLYDKEKIALLPFPYRMEALTNGIATTQFKEEYTSSIEPLPWTFALENTDTLTATKTENGYRVEVTTPTTVYMKLPSPLQNKILWITFDLGSTQSCTVGDLQITINGNANTLTCKEWKYYNDNTNFRYILNEEENLEDLEIHFEKGTYEIENVKMYTLSLEEVLHYHDSIVSPTKIEYQKNHLKAEISLDTDSYVQVTIPFDEGFTVYDNDKEVNIEKTGANFLGFPVEKGEHQIDIVFHAKGFRLGKMITALGLILFFGVFILEKERRKQMQKIKEFMKKHREIIHYIIAGVLTTLVSISSYAIFRIFQIHYLVSTVLSWVLSVLFAYFINKIYVFESKTKQDYKEFFRFIQYRLFSLFIEFLTMYLLVDLLKIPDGIAKIIVQGIVFLLNYIFSKLFVFSKNK